MLSKGSKRQIYQNKTFICIAAFCAIVILVGTAVMVVMLKSTENEKKLEHHWNYFEQEKWPALCLSGKNQSPIALNENASNKSVISNLWFENIDYFENIEVINDGHSVKVKLDHCRGAKPKLSGGGLKSNYTLENIHFHWPSEHTINGIQYDLESHFVFFCDEYKNIREASEHLNGVTVIAVLYAESNITQHDNFKVINNAVKEVSTKAEDSTFFRYSGSLTTPDCMENINWIVFKNPSNISKEDINTGIEDKNVFVESLIAMINIIGYKVAYITCLKSKTTIKNIFDDINIFLQYCEPNVIHKPDELYRRYLKYIEYYVFIAVSFNLTFPLVTRKSCIANKGSEFYLRHDPCGMATRNFYPFDASQSTIFWVVFITEGLYIFHVCYVFCVVSTFVVAIFGQIAAQLRNCGLSFQQIDFDKKTSAAEQLTVCVKYHKDILTYAHRVFTVFRPLLTAYMILTSFATAVIGYQIVVADVNVEDKYRYILLLIAWGFLFFIICLHSQMVQDESVALANYIYNSQWASGCSHPKIRRNIVLIIARAQKPLHVKINLLGTINLAQFVAVMKSAYSFFTILLAATED